MVEGFELALEIVGDRRRLELDWPAIDRLARALAARVLPVALGLDVLHPGWPHRRLGALLDALALLLLRPSRAAIPAATRPV
eukprot:1020184-Alexandrium_andersonii.AAC.1